MVSQDFAEIARLISDADLVIGVFPDHQSPDGMWHVVIKGIRAPTSSKRTGRDDDAQAADDSVR